MAPVERQRKMANSIYRTAFLFGLALLAAGCGGSDQEPSEGQATSEVLSGTEVLVVYDTATFGELVPADAQVTRVAGDMQFLEGPVWRAEEGGHLLFSDVAANEMKRWDAAGGVTTFRAPSGPSNGNTLDLEGRLVTAQHDGRVTRTEADGSVVTLVEEYMGNALSSPNDVVVKSDGSIWFTDPEYGLGDRERETPGNYVYRFDPGTSTLTAVITDTTQPNGLCFAPDESVLYIADSDPSTRHIRSFSVAAGGTVSGGDVFATLDQGSPDGIRCDERGNVWSSSGDGVQIFSPTGSLIGRVLLPESGANLTFGGADGRTVYVTAKTSLYSFPVLVGDAHQR